MHGMTCTTTTTLLFPSCAQVIRLVDCGINMMLVINGYVAVACRDGSVRFYDYSLRLEAWFEDMAAGAVTSLSFSVQDCPYAAGEGGSPGLQFWVPEFIVSYSFLLRTSVSNYQSI